MITNTGHQRPASLDSRTSRHALAAFVLVLLSIPGAAVHAQTVLAGQWLPQGPAPALDGQTENVAPNDEVTGAVHVVLPHPSDADVLYAGGTNAGVWKTTNATASQPTWTELTDAFASLSIGAMAFDSADATHRTIYAGTGRFSSYGDGGDRVGLLRSTDGGQSWTVVDGGGTLVGKNISGLAVDGDEIVVSVNTTSPFAFGQVGIFRSTDGGQTFTVLSVGDGSNSPLPGGIAHDLVRDAATPARLFTSIARAHEVGGENGLYRSDDFGATWSRVSDAAIESLFVSGSNNAISNIEFAAGPGGSVFAAIVRFGRLAGVFRSGDGGGAWTAMELPTTSEDDGEVFGIHPGGQGSIHMSIAADPTDPQIVYVGGDRQPCFIERSDPPPESCFPNSLGATDYSGRLFRGDASAAAGSQWTPLTHGGTASDSSPHADSREMAFDAAGDLLEADDGGVYRRTQPRTGAGDWFSLNANLAATEYHGIAYDAVSDIIIGGAQDTGTTEQLLPGGAIFASVSTADGGDPAVDDTSSTTQSTRYSSFQFLNGFRRRVVDADNNVLSDTILVQSLIDAGVQPQFYTPVAVNGADGDRLLIGAANALFESLNRGDSFAAIAGVRVNAFAGDPMVYGVPGHPDLLVAAVNFALAGGQLILVRTDPPPAAPAARAPPSANRILDLAIDPDAPDTLFAITATTVYRSYDFGTRWTDVTGSLIGKDPGRLRSLAFVTADNVDSLVVGANRGVYVADRRTGFSGWSDAGSGLANAPVFELEYDALDDALVAGLLGRGAWKLQPVTLSPDLLFFDSFDSP